MDANGDEIVDASGDEFIKCCCGSYVQARLCSNHTDADQWFQYRVSGGTPQLYDVSTASWVNLSFYFQISTTVYYVDSTCNVSAAPGTLASSYTVKTGCYTCVGCTGSFPGEFLVTFAGITQCDCVLDGSSFYETLIVDPNGTYVTQAGSGCNSFKTFTGTAWLSFDTVAGCPSPSPTGNTAQIQLNTASGILAFNVTNILTGGFRSIFYGTFTPTVCARTVTVSNLLTTCLGTVGGSNAAVGTGGSATVTPL